MIVFSRRIVLGVVAVGATALAVAGAVPANAVTTVTLTAGSAPAGTIVAIKSVSASISLKDLTTNATGSCTSTSLTGTMKTGANSPSNFALINGGAGQVAFNSCQTLGLPYTISGVGTAKWPIAATGNTTSGTTPMNITGINVVVSSSSCTFNVSGSLAGSFVNGTSASSPSKAVIPATTAATSKLVVSNFALKGSSTKCLGGAITNTSPGNKIAVAGTWTKTATTAAYNPLAIVAS